LECDGTRAETRFHLSAKRTSPFISARASVQSTTGSRGVRISGSNAGYTMFRGSVKGTGYSLHSPVSPSFPLPCVTVCHHISTGLQHKHWRLLQFWVMRTRHDGPKTEQRNSSVLSVTLVLDGDGRSTPRSGIFTLQDRDHCTGTGCEKLFIGV